MQYRRFTWTALSIDIPASPLARSNFPDHSSEATTMTSESMLPHRVLFATPEIAPLSKVGGLADVSSSLTSAMRRIGLDVRLVIPGYGIVKQAMRNARPLLPLVDDQGRQGQILQVELPDHAAAYVVDLPDYFEHLESPYAQDDLDTFSQASRFMHFARGALQIAVGELAEWQPDIVHCNDWTTGLIPALLAGQPDRPASVYTIHNLAYQGLFPRQHFERLSLPEPLWSMHAMEFHGQFSFAKGGLVFADALNTVSPTYAREILTSEFGWGLEGLLQLRQNRLCGILNGVDYTVWNPATDALLSDRYQLTALDGKRACKRVIQRRFDIDEDHMRPLIGVVSRLTDQKGIDLIIAALDRIVANAQLILLGTGDRGLESALINLRERHPRQVGIILGYDEALSHQIVAGADMFLMPSRFEPCGLTQLYSLKYGTIPIVHRTGGLADTVVDATPEALAKHLATGICYQPSTADALARAIERAVALYHSEHWQNLQHAGMTQDFSWERSAAAYLELYRRALSFAQR